MDDYGLINNDGYVMTCLGWDMGIWECAGNLDADHVHCIPGWFVIFQGIQIDMHGSKSSRELQPVSWLCCNGSLTSNAIPIAVAVEIQSILLSKHPSCHIVAAKTMMITADTITKLGPRNE